MAAWKIAFAAMLACTPAMGMQGSAGSPASAPTNVDNQTMFDAAARLAGGASELSRIWRGYWPEDQGFVLQTRGEGALLVLRGEPPVGFEPVTEASSPLL